MENSVILAIYILTIHFKCETMKSIYNASFYCYIHTKKVVELCFILSGDMPSELLLSLVICPSSLSIDRYMYEKLASFKPLIFQTEPPKFYSCDMSETVVKSFNLPCNIRFCYIMYMDNIRCTRTKKYYGILCLYTTLMVFHTTHCLFWQHSLSCLGYTNRKMYFY